MIEARSLRPAEPDDREALYDPLSLALAIAFLLVVPHANAATEAGDAGDLPATAQDLSAQGVVQIDGAFAIPTDVDVYKLCLSGGGTFSASTVEGTTVDTQLFLFNSSGLGVYGNDDEGALRQSTLPAGHPLTLHSPRDTHAGFGTWSFASARRATCSCCARSAPGPGAVASSCSGSGTAP
jgi:hypothetical protein